MSEAPYCTIYAPLDELSWDLWRREVVRSLDAAIRSAKRDGYSLDQLEKVSITGPYYPRMFDDQVAKPEFWLEFDFREQGGMADESTGAVEILKRRYIGQDAKRRRMLHWECLGFWGKVGHLLTAPFRWVARCLREYVGAE